MAKQERIPYDSQGKRIEVGDAVYFGRSTSDYGKVLSIRPCDKYDYWSFVTVVRRTKKNRVVEVYAHHVTRFDTEIERQEAMIATHREKKALAEALTLVP